MVKGIRPLNLELSWVYVISTHSSSVARFTLVPISPFKYGNKVPTNEEVSRVSEDILNDLTIPVDADPERDEARRLLSDLVSPTPLESVSGLSFVEYTHPEDFAVAEILYNDSIRPHQLILTRDERNKISGTGANLSGSPAPDSPQFPAGPAGGDTDTAPDFDGGGSHFEELEFNSQIPQTEFAELEYLQPEGYEGESEDEFLPTPAKRRRLGDFSPVVGSPLESHLVPSDSDRMFHTILPPTAEPTSPRQIEMLNNSHFPQFSPALQNTHVLLGATSQPRDPVRPNPPDTTHHFVPPVTGGAVELSHVPATGSRRDFTEFLALRGVRPNAPPAATTTVAAIDNPLPTKAPQTLQLPLTKIPPDLIDGNTVQLPTTNSLPISRHQYLASLDLLQKHALCRCLSDDPAAIDLVEREFLGGVDLILDQDTALLFLPLSALPSECEGIISGISDISWRYSHILVIFEAFLVSQALGDREENRVVSFAFTEPISKSVKKLKRSLMIAEGVGTKTEDCLVSWAFAKNIEEAARLARVYGDMAEGRDKTGGLLWQERWWLGEREAEDSPLFEFKVRLASSFQTSPLPHGMFRMKVILQG